MERRTFERDIFPPTVLTYTRMAILRIVRLLSTHSGWMHFDVRGVAGARQRCGFSPNHFDHLLFHIGSGGFSIYRWRKVTCIASKPKTAVWCSGINVAHINEVVLRRARLSTENPLGASSSCYVINHPRLLRLLPSAGQEMYRPGVVMPLLGMSQPMWRQRRYGVVLDFAT